MFLRGSNKVAIKEISPVSSSMGKALKQNIVETEIVAPCEPGMLRFLRGNKSSPTLSGCQEFYSELKRYLNGVEIGVFDLETGGDAKLGKKYGIPVGDEALYGHSAEVLLAGWMPGTIVNYDLISAEGNEKGVIKALVQRIDETYNRGGAIMGHNVLGFDIPLLIERCRILNITHPLWMARVASKNKRGKSDQTRVYDTLHVYSPHAKFSTYGLSLSDTAALWGRSFESHGAKFGEIWRGANPDDRATLKLYNLWNLLDSMALAVFTGAADRQRGGAGKCHNTPQLPPTPWIGSERYHAKAAPEKGKQWNLKNPNNWVFSWITAPLPRLYENGPSASHGWGKITTDDAKLKYPFQSGYYNPQCVRIVGAACGGPDGVNFIFNPDDEVAVISSGLKWLHDHQGEAGIWINDLAGFRSLTVYRASIYNAIVPDWVVFGKRELLKDVGRLETLGGDLDAWTVGNVAEEAGVIKSGLELVNPPLYCGQEADHLLDSATTWLKAASIFIHISTVA